ncbi:MAG TPA: hypothetical protein VMS64_06270 [Candidatus Methylomirabilis sp.]|nr:hypothetical protein [Candidatus Methylomirabilis sp.]
MTTWLPVPPITALLLFLASAVGVTSDSVTASAQSAPPTDADTDPPEVQLGERLFLETRFAQFFFANSDGDVNGPLTEGDPVMSELQTTGAPLPGPFAGQSMNCRQCHLVDELKDISPFDVRTYADFARRSPIPGLESDSQTTTPRNAPPLVNASLARDVPAVFHFDGEFSTIEGLVIGTFTGRNFGWQPTQVATATAHIASVIRGDDGNNDLAQSFSSPGVPYRVLFLGTDPSIPPQLLIPVQYRIDVATATDDQVLSAVAAVVRAYVDSLRFSTDDTGQYNGSPYDAFLIKNDLPRSPDPGETNLAYSQRLLGLINGLAKPKFVYPSSGAFELHDQKFKFGPDELAGLKIFFSQPHVNSASLLALNRSRNPLTRGFGNCVACHTPPNFTDFRFHNTGASQVEYDMIFGSGAFAALDIPGLATRNGHFDSFLPPSPAHPNATGRFRSAASRANPGYTDLGVWNIFANPDTPNPQASLTTILCGLFNLNGAACTPGVVLPLSVSYFKTPSLRDLGQSSPYLHTGAFDSFVDVLQFYITTSGLARKSLLFHGSPELVSVIIDADDIPALDAFLQALNEDYD